MLVHDSFKFVNWGNNTYDCCARNETTYLFNPILQLPSNLELNKRTQIKHST